MENTTPLSARNSYVLTSADAAAGTYLYAETMLVPAAVIRCFGDGDPGGECKVSRSWTFRKGELIFTLYEWKSTNLYEPGMLTQEQLWSLEKPFPLHIGSREPATREDALEFGSYLRRITSQIKPS